MVIIGQVDQPVAIIHDSEALTIYLARAVVVSDDCSHIFNIGGLHPNLGQDPPRDMRTLHFLEMPGGAAVFLLRRMDSYVVQEGRSYHDVCVSAGLCLEDFFGEGGHFQGMSYPSLVVSEIGFHLRTNLFLEV